MRIKYFVATAVLATAILCFGGAVGAQTIDNSAVIAQLQAQIAQLLAQIKVLQAQQGTTTTWCFTFTKNLYLGIAGGDVQYLQTVLVKQGLLLQGDIDQDNGGANIEGPSNFGENTAAAVVQFQAKYKIRQTGTVGPITREKLNSLYGCSTTPSTCTPNWQCTWGTCTNGYQSQTATDLNNCGVTTGNNIACTALAKVCPVTAQPTNGTCGSATDQTFSTAPAVNLCSSGTASAVTLPGQVGGWYWTCAGLNGGTSTHCTASIGPAKPKITSLGTSNALPGEKVAAYVSNLPANFSTVYMEFSGGADSTMTLSADKTYLGFTVPNLTPGNYTIYALFLNATGAEIARSNSMSFTITSASTKPTITSITPTQGSDGTVVTIYGLNLSGATTVEFYAAGSQPMGSLAPSSVSSQSLTFTISGIFAANMTPGFYQVGVVTNACAGGCGSNRIGFTLTSAAAQPSITITSPNGGENWKAGEIHTITLNKSAQVTSVDIFLQYMAPGRTEYPDIIAQNVSGMNYTWVVPNVPTDSYKISIQPHSLPDVIATLSQPFTIISATPQPTNGVCGSSNGTTVASVPTTNLCSTGTASTVSGPGPWTWTCAGSSGGTNANCSAALKASPLVVSCSGSPNPAIIPVPSSLYTSITWTATASGGTSPYTYLWSGDIYAASGTCSNSSTCVHNYNTLGTQTITVSVTSGTQTATASCSGNTSLPTASYNVSQSSLADISAALSNIAQKIQQLLGK